MFDNWGVSLTIGGLVKAIEPGGGPEPTPWKPLADSSAVTVVVGHRGGLARVGVEYIEVALSAQGHRVLVAGPSATSQATGDLAREVTGVLSWMCAGLSGCRWARGRAEKAVAAVSG